MRCGANADDHARYHRSAPLHRKRPAFSSPVLSPRRNIVYPAGVAGNGRAITPIEEITMTKRVSLFSSFLLLGMALVFLGSSRQASAQVPGAGLPSGIGISAFIPTSSEAVRKGGAIQAAAELRYGLPSVPLTPTRTVLSVG